MTLNTYMLKKLHNNLCSAVYGFFFARAAREQEWVWSFATKTLDTLATFEALLGLSIGGAVVLLGHVKMHGKFRSVNRKKRRYFLQYPSVIVRIILKLIWKEYGRRECRLDSYLDRDLLTLR